VTLLTTYKIVVADDSSVFRSNLRRFLERNSDFTVIGEAQDGGEALALIEELAPDILLLDIEMPHMDGMEVLQHLQDAASSVCVLVISAHASPSYRKQALHRGAAGFLVKEEVPSQLFSTIYSLMTM
jgi:DNA-binding NarL/FixJ family response regulator